MKRVYNAIYNPLVRPTNNLLNILIWSMSSCSILFSLFSSFSSVFQKRETDICGRHKLKNCPIIIKWHHIVENENRITIWTFDRLRDWNKQKEKILEKIKWKICLWNEIVHFHSDLRFIFLCSHSTQSFLESVKQICAICLLTSNMSIVEHPSDIYIDHELQVQPIQ